MTDLSNIKVNLIQLLLLNINIKIIIINILLFINKYYNYNFQNL